MNRISLADPLWRSIAALGLSAGGAFAQDVAKVSLDAAITRAVSAARPQTAQWRPLLAPGSAMTPSADTRRTWLALVGWQKVILSPPTNGPRAAAVQLLPDLWARDRDYERAIYVLSADFGVVLPESLWLRFDAIGFECQVFVNGTFVGRHLGGYTPFEFDITRAARPGVNTVALLVRDEHAVISTEKQAAVSQVGVTRPGLFISPAGIRGGIWFDARSSVHVERVLVHTSTRQNEIRVTTWLRGPMPANATVTHAIYAWPGDPNSKPVLELAPRDLRPGETVVEVTQSWRDALRWSPEHPHLYVLRTTIRVGEKSETSETRFGFREFWTEGKNFVLNGTPVRLIGTSVARDLNLALTPGVARHYAHDVFTFYKNELNYRAIRLHAIIHGPGPAEAADEVGLLVINQSSIWSAMGGYYQRGADELLKNSEREFAEWFWRDANNPSVVIWDVENEMIRDQRTPERERWVLALDRFIKQLDPTRITEHAGAAWFSPRQETIHLHMQEQYAEPLLAWARDGRAPLVVGEFWVGGRGGETRLTSSYEFSGRADWHQEESRLYREKILEMRNYGASGVMPFWLDRTLLGRVNESLRRTYDPKTDTIFKWSYPSVRNLGAEALAPVVAFAWPRDGSVVEGGALEKEVVVCNDFEEQTEFTVRCDFAGQHQEWKTTLAPAAQERRTISFPAASGELLVTVADSTGRKLSSDLLVVHAIRASLESAPKLSRRVVVVPKPSAGLAEALHELGVTYETTDALPGDAAHTLLLVLPDAPRDALGSDSAVVGRFLAAGGRLLVLSQTQAPAWMPINLPFWSAVKKSAPEFTLLGWPDATKNLLFSRELPLYAPGHPVFAGLAPSDFSWWDKFDGRVADDAFARPNATDTRAGAPYRVLAGATRRENASLVETVCGDGTAIFCQAQVLAQRAHPPARTLFFNLLRYLDGPAWYAEQHSVGFVGDLAPARLTALTGLPSTAFVKIDSAASALPVIIAGDHADTVLLDGLARAGHTVIVLSRETAGRLPGYAVIVEPNRIYAGTRAGAVDDSSFWGVATANFLPLAKSPATGALKKFPTDARVVLGGLSRSGRARGDEIPGAAAVAALDTFDTDQPLAVIEPHGAGRLIVTTLEPWNASSEAHRQLLCTLLANAGVALPNEGGRASSVAVKPTAPLRFDGRLDDWTNDMEDRNVSPFQHAVPVVLSNRDVADGKSDSDLALSAVLYFLRDPDNLYLGGIVFSTDPALLTFDLGGKKISLDFSGGGLTLDGQPLVTAQLKLGQQTAREVVDTRLLTLVTVNAQIGSTASAGDAPGRTFESAVAWKALGFESAPRELAARIELRGADGRRLQLPAKSTPALELKIGN